MHFDLMNKTASLARLHLTEEEKQDLGLALDQMLEFFGELNSIVFPDDLDIQGGDKTLIDLDVPDAEGQPQDVQAVLANAPERKDDFFTVPRAI